MEQRDGRVGTLAGVNALAGGVGGGLADTVTQLGQWAMGDRSGFSFRQAFAAMVAGAAGGAAGYMASRALFKACFIKGTLILTPTGWREIEELVEGDLVLSRNEHDPNGELVARRVLRTFVRVSPVLNLHVRGKVIGTTGEHPFYVLDKDWTAARELAIGDVLLSHDGQRVLVEGIADSGRIETVYNVEVEHDHTYFVGGEDCSIWAHNAEYVSKENDPLVKKTKKMAGDQQQESLEYTGKGYSDTTKASVAEYNDGTTKVSGDGISGGDSPDFHTALEQRIQDVTPDPNIPHQPGDCSETKAVNSVLKQLDPTGEIINSGNIGQYLSKMKFACVGVVDKKPAARPCNYCQQILDVI